MDALNTIRVSVWLARLTAAGSFRVSAHGRSIDYRDQHAIN